MKEGKTLIIITPGFPKDENDSTCLPSQQLFVLTVKRLFPALEIKIVALQYPYDADTYVWNGIEVYPLNGKKNSGILRPVLWLRAYALLRKLTKGRSILGILSFWCNETALIGQAFAASKKFQHKIWISGQDARERNGFVKWIRPRPDDLVAMSDFLKQEFEKNHSIKVGHVICNGVLPTFTNNECEIDLMGAGSLITLKQYNVFVDIVSDLRKKNKNINAILFGKGPEEANLRKQIVALDLTGNFQLKGEAHHASLMDWMSRAKIFVHPSAYEGYSTVCLEALANGCQVVSFTYAENHPVKHWHVVKNKTEMLNRISELLEGKLDPSPVIARNMETSVREMIALFHRSG